MSLLGIALIALSDARPPVSEQKVKIENVGKKSEHHEAYVSCHFISYSIKKKKE